MDDIYFSDKKKNNRKDSASETIKNVTDKFVDDDYDDEDIDIKSHTSKPVADKNKNFKVNLPDFDLDVPKPAHITAPSKDIYSSSGARTPQGRRMAPSQSAGNSTPHRPEIGRAHV